MNNGGRPGLTGPTASPDRPARAPMEAAREVADAVMYDGHPPDPRREPAPEHLWWRCGALLPPAYARAGDRRALHTECLLETRDDVSLQISVRCLQVQAKAVQERRYGSWRDVPSLTIAGVAHTSGDEAVEREVNAIVAVDALVAGPREEHLLLPGGADVAALPGDPDQRVGRVVRRRWPIAGKLRIAATPLPGPYGVIRLRLEVSNVDDWPGGGRTSGEEALRHSLIATHLLVAATDGSFLSLLDPPVWARPAAADCDNDGVFPVLAGAPGHTDVVLASPAILYDHPVIHPVVGIDDIADPTPTLSETALSDVDGLGATGPYREQPVVSPPRQHHARWTAEQFSQANGGN